MVISIVMVEQTDIIWIVAVVKRVRAFHILIHSITGFAHVRNPDGLVIILVTLALIAYLAKSGRSLPGKDSAMGAE